MTANPKASTRMKAHWSRCERIAALLQHEGIEFTKLTANRHWSCCLKRVCPNRDFPETLTRDEKLEVGVKMADAYKAHLARQKEQDKQHTARQAKRRVEHQKRVERQETPRRRPGKTTIADRVGMAIWLIRQCGSVAKAQDAMDRAKRSLTNKRSRKKDPDGGK